jgi:hypothetical protein
MKRAALATALLLLILVPAFAADQSVDTVYLKDGSVLKGAIKSLTEESLRIVTSAGLDITIAMDKVERFERGGAKDSSRETGSAAGAAPMLAHAFEVNLLGLLQFGPYARLYLPLGSELFLAPHVRVGYLGALNYILWGAGSFTAGASVLWFMPTDGPNRFYAGPFAEVGIDGETDFIAVLGTNVGYRWRFPNRQYLNTGLIAGVSYDFWDEIFVFAGMLELSWGIEY